MPIYNGHFVENLPAGGQRPSPTMLAALGPVLAVSVSIPQALAAFNTSQQLPLPSPITGLALIDTGATRSCVHAPIMSNLGVNPIGAVSSTRLAGLYVQSQFKSHYVVATNRAIISSNHPSPNFTAPYSNKLGSPVAEMLPWLVRIKSRKLSSVT